MSFSFTVQELSQIDLLWNFVDNQGLQDEVQLLPKELDVKSGELHPPLGFPGISSQIQLVRNIRALCGFLRTPPGLAMPVYDGLNDFSP